MCGAWRRDRARTMTIPRPCSSSACRVPAPRSSSRSGCPCRCTVPASGLRLAICCPPRRRRRNRSSVERIAALDADSWSSPAGYLAELHALAPGATRIVDKMPGNYRLLGLIALLFPGARIIDCHRDPRDIGLSIFTLRFFGHHPYANDLSDLGWYIAQHGV